MQGDLLTECKELSQHFYPYSPVDADMECISYPFPNNRNGISVMVRAKGDPTTIREVSIADSDWR